MSDRTVSFVRSMVTRFPSLGPLLEEHVKDNDGILPHVFLGELTRHALSLTPEANNGGAIPSRELRDLLDHLEDAYSGGDEELQELISVSFLENLPRIGEVGSEIRDLIGPSLSRQLRAMD